MVYGATSNGGRQVRIALALLLTVVLAAAVGGGSRTAKAEAAAALPTGFQQKTVFSGLTAPTNVEFATDGRVFVAEKSGLIKVFDSLTDTTASVYADLRTQVYNFGDRGLLGLALHPDFPTDPRVYVLYTLNGELGGPVPKWPGDGTFDQCPGPPGGPGATTDGCVASGRLSVLTALPSGAPEERVLIEDWCQQYPSHSVGTIAFGPDKSLYAGAGDGAGYVGTDYGQDRNTAADVTPDNPCADPPQPRGTALSPPTSQGGALRAQDMRTTADPTTLDGSIIRINPDNGLPAAGNPTTTGDDNAKRIIAYGLRNPFRFTVRPGTSEIWAGDVGMGFVEEINRIPSPTAGVRNFGWPCYEGVPRHSGYDGHNLTLCENLYAAGTTAVYNGFYNYRHDAAVGGCAGSSSSSSGVAFYNGASYPAASGYKGALFFADYSRKCVWVMKTDTPGGLPNTAKVEAFASGGIVELQAGPGGDIFAVDVVNGQIVRYVYTTGNAPPEAAFKADKTTGPLPLTVNFDGRVSSDSDGQALTYQWDLDGDGMYETVGGATQTRTYTDKAKVTVRLRVSDGQATDTASIVVNAGYTPPAARIDTPTAGTTWKVNDTIGFSGTATDAEDGPLPGTSLRWKTIMHHCPSSCHAHVLSEQGGATGDLSAIDHEHPSWLELQLTATDSDGLTDTQSLRLNPKTVTLTFASNPAGAQLTAVDATMRAPFTRTVIVGSSVPVTAASPQVYGDNAYRFGSWSDGGAATHPITAPATSTTYTANFFRMANLARGRSVRVSSVEAAGLEGPKGVDGNLTTRWSSKRTDPQWIEVDLGSVQRVGRSLQRWEAAYGKNYRIEVSTGGGVWTTVNTRLNGDGAVDHTAWTPVDARWVRMYGLKRGTAYGYSLWEFEIYNG